MTTRLTQLANRQTGQPANFSEFNYTYDSVGNRKAMTTSSGTHNYTYDNIYQLKAVDYPAGVTFPDATFNYDDVGNRTSKVNGGTTNYASNSLNQYTQVGTTNYTYDANGSLTNDGAFTYAFDYENRLTSATKTGTNATYKYDAFGRRIEKTVNGITTKFLYDGDQIIAEYDGAGTLITKFIYGAGIDEVISLTKGANTYYYHYDGLGSVANLTNSTGSTIETYSYDVFGKPSTTSTLGNTRLFTGREYDSETGLYYYRARYYSPTVGRFLQRDPVGYRAGINLYSYCLNNPVNWVDPRGWDKQGNKGNFPGGYSNPPDTTPESPKPEEKPKTTSPADPRPKDPSPKVPTSYEPISRFMDAYSKLSSIADFILIEMAAGGMVVLGGYVTILGISLAPETGFLTLGIVPVGLTMGLAGAGTAVIGWEYLKLNLQD